MRRSKEIKLTLLASLALTLTACHDDHRDCVDSQNRVQPDSYCQDTHSPYYGGYHYLYGGRSGGHYGDSVIGGSISRGGFVGSFGSGGHFGGGE